MKRSVKIIILISTIFLLSFIALVIHSATIPRVEPLEGGTLCLDATSNTKIESACKRDNFLEAILLHETEEFPKGFYFYTDNLRHYESSKKLLKEKFVFSTNASIGDSLQVAPTVEIKGDEKVCDFASKINITKC